MHMLSYLCELNVYISLISRLSMKTEDVSAFALIHQSLMERRATALCTENLLHPVIGKWMKRWY